MIVKRLNNIFLILGLFLTFVSCSKEGVEGCTNSSAINYNPSADIDNGSCEFEESSTTVLSDTDLLCTGLWYLTDKERTDTLTQVTTNTYASLNDCIKDNTFRFYYDATLAKGAGSLKCNTTEPQIENGIWSWGNSHSEITFNLPYSGLTDYLIVSLDATTFIITNTDQGYLYKSTFKHSQ
ncbi:MAG: hypothetical protein ACPGSL_10505 [Vicingaceae bacterium]